MASHHAERMLLIRTLFLLQVVGMQVSQQHVYVPVTSAEKKSNVNSLNPAIEGETGCQLPKAF